MLGLVILLFLSFVECYLHPITVHGKYFVDTVTNEPFYIKGVDYQPGGSSGNLDLKDPLSNPEECARDIVLFQLLGINTIRIYSVNTEFNHDKCMSMLAAAGIYLVLDVNSPLPNHHLNRYEPWTSYNADYLENAFKVVEQFSYYNNTLCFFAGNEVVNDITSAKNSPVYVKAMVRDIKEYINSNSPRHIPVGYSAADDLKYRISFSRYLECMEDSPAEAVDFYGVNSYQWCGEQTFFTSGYNSLVEDYASYSRPLFFSEYGCNEVLPRQFGEIETLYSTDMIDVFSGGLIYQFTQEQNNYGLVEILDNGDAKLLPDFFTLKGIFDRLDPIDSYHVSHALKQNNKYIQNVKKVKSFDLPSCESTYENIDVSKGLPKPAAPDLIKYGVKVDQGSFVVLSQEEITCSYNIFNPQDNKYQFFKKIKPVTDYMAGTKLEKSKKINYDNGMYIDQDEGELEDELENKQRTILGVISDYITKVFNKVKYLIGQ